MSDTTPDIQYDAFISYARADGRDLAERLYLALKEHGLRPWRDERDLNPFQDFSVGIERAIRASRYVVVILTPDVIEREDSFVRREILEAQARHKDIIPLITADFDPADVPISIKHLTWLRFAGFNTQFRELLNRLAASPGYTPPPPSDDPFRPYVERLRDFVTSELEASLLNIHDMLLLRSKDTPDAVAAPPPPVLPTAFKSRVVRHNEPTLTPPPPERDFDNFNDVFAAHDGRVLLLGEPGAGKTTTLLAFAREKAIARLSSPVAPLPVYAPLAGWDGESELADWLSASTGVDATALRRELAEKRALLILDGLDEMASAWRDLSKPDTEPRDFRLEFLKLLKLVDTSALVACRIRDYNDITAKGGEKITLNGAISLQPLSDEQIRSYLKDQPELWDALQADSALLDMARTPLLLTLLGIGYRDSSTEERAQLSDLNQSPGELRDRIFANYITKRYEHERIHSLEPLLYTLDELTILLGNMVENLLGSTYLKDFTGIDEWYMVKPDETMLIDLAVRLHLLRPDGRHKWRFLHLRLRDYLGFPIAIAHLGHTDADMRRQASTALGRMRDVRALESLIPALSDPDWRVRLAVATALGNIGDKRAVEPLLMATLNEPRWEVPISAIDALGHIGTPAIDPLIAALGDVRWAIRISAADALQHIGIAVIDPLIVAITDSDWGMRRFIINILAQFDDKRIIHSIINILTDSDVNNRIISVIALGRIADPLAVQPLTLLLADTSRGSRDRVCDAAAHALERIATPEALAAVEEWRRNQSNNQ